MGSLLGGRKASLRGLNKARFVGSKRCARYLNRWAINAFLYIFKLSQISTDSRFQKTPIAIAHRALFQMLVWARWDFKFQQGISVTFWRIAQNVEMWRFAVNLFYKLGVYET